MKTERMYLYLTVRTGCNFRSGTGQGQYTVKDLLSQTEYTFIYVIYITPESYLLGEVTVTTPPPRSTLSAVAVDSATIDLVYNFTNGENVSLFRKTQG